MDIKGKVRWVIQDNLISENDLGELQSACKELGVLHQDIRVIPFSDGIPSHTIDDIPNIYYGSTTLIANIYRDLKPIGVFFDSKTFSMKNYIEKWGDYMLSSEASVMPFKELVKKDIPSDKQIFLRPDEDSKAFAGIVIEFGKIIPWFDNLMTCDSVGLGPDTLVLAGPAYNIQKEWRNYVVNGKVVTSTRYRQNFNLSKSGNDIPSDMIKFVEDRCKEYTPHDVFAMDIALCGGDYYIIECGCMNSVGFYSCSILDYVRCISEYVCDKRYTRV